MKALILAGGRGKRVEELSSQSNKCLIPVNGKPVIEYSLSIAASLDIEDIIIVVGYCAEEIINKYGIEYKGKKISYVLQSEQNGLVHAIVCARKMLADSDFMLFLGDEVFIDPKHREMLDKFRNNNMFGICGVLKVKNKELISQTYGVLTNGNQIYRLIEKPANPQNNYMGTGDCIFKNKILEYIDITPTNYQRNQKE